MNYDAYRRTTDGAAGAIRNTSIPARVVSLAGGYYGVAVPVDRRTDIDRHDAPAVALVILCRDYDGGGEWIAWAEDGAGERCCDDNTVTVGHVRPINYAPELLSGAARAAAHYAAHAA